MEREVKKRAKLNAPSSNTQRERNHIDPKVLILRLRLVPFMNFTGLRAASLARAQRLGKFPRLFVYPIFLRSP